MINLATITAAVKTLLDDGLDGYNINRNAARNTDPQVAARTNGWINVQRGSLNYRPHSTGSQPWLAQIGIRVEVQVASIKSGEDAEDKLQTAEKAVMDVLNGDRKLGSTVDQVTGYDITYEFNDAGQVYHHAAVITINAEVRT